MLENGVIPIPPARNTAGLAEFLCSVKEPIAESIFTTVEAATSVDWVTFRELATTLKPRSTNPFTIPAPIPCEAPVTMAVFGEPLMVVYLANVFSLEKSLVKRIRNPHPAQCGNGPCLIQLGR